MRIDLDDLERKASAATRDPRAQDEWERDNLVHQPQFALALIARIRELEDGLRELVDSCSAAASAERRAADQLELTRSGAVDILEKGAVTTPAYETPETTPTSALVTVEIDAKRVNPGDVVRSHCLTCGVAIYCSVRATSDLCLACWRADLDQKSLPITSAWSPPFVAVMLDERGGLRWASGPGEDVVVGEPVCRATCPGLVTCMCDLGRDHVGRHAGNHDGDRLEWDR